VSPLHAVSTVTGTAWIPDHILQLLFAEADRFAPKETGGILLGYWSDSPREPVITQHIDAGPGALHAPGRFRPDHEYQEAEISRRYAASNRTLSYLGDWHSHPRGSTSLSVTDVSTLRRIALSRQARAQQPLMLIIAEGPRWLPTAWTLRRKRRCLVLSHVLEQWHVATFHESRSLPDAPTGGSTT
jgi:integrative and conjugative element protein (TIGR02256 family)